jgi:hypothetical protein
MDAKELEEYAAYYLARLEGDPSALDSLTEADPTIVPILLNAFRSERRPRLRRLMILSAIIIYRDPASIEYLAEALHDPVFEVWDTALAGLIALDRPECLAILEAARRRRFERETEDTYFRTLLEEAIEAVRHGFFGEKDSEV